VVIHRGDICWAALPEPRGSEPGYRRPVLVVQADEFNRSRIRTVMVVPVTSSTRLARAPGNVLLGRADTGLPKDSVANVSQVITIDRSFLSADSSRSLSARLMHRVDSGLRLALSL